MKLIVGLGNPGSAYVNTRHNAGFLVVDALQNLKLPKDCIVKKSDTFMNDSGSFVAKMLKAYSIQLDSLYVIHDDLDIKLGEYKIQFGRGPKDHNGIGDIENKLGTKDFWRVRVGIENRHSEIVGDISRGPMRGVKRSLIGGEEYVLQNFTEEERIILDKVIQEVCKKLVTP